MSLRIHIKFSAGERGSHAALPFFGFPAAWGLLLSLMCGACYAPERDLLQDPYNTPLVHILDAEFDAAAGGVRLQAEYLGRDTPLEFVISRRLDGPFDSIGAVGAAERLSDDQYVVEFVDTAPTSGRLVDYSVHVRTSGLAADALPVQVQIPGALLRGLRVDNSAGTMEVVWQNSGSAARYDVLRQRGGESETVVFTTTDPSVVKYTDHQVDGNRRYRYRVVTTTQEATTLTTQQVEGRFFVLLETDKVAGYPLPAGTFLRLSGWGGSSGATVLGLVARDVDFSLQAIRYGVGTDGQSGVTVFSIRESSTTLDAAGVRPGSASVAGPSPFSVVHTNPRVYVSGVRSADRRVVLESYALPGVSRVWEGPQGWYVANEGDVARVSADAANRVFVAAGGGMRVYSEGFVELSRMILPFRNPLSLFASRTTIWAVAAETNRLMAARISTSTVPLNLAWEDRTPSDVAQPVSVAENHRGQVFVLDGSAGTVNVYDLSGERLLGWELPAGDYRTGTVVIDGGSAAIVHVSNAAGEIFSYLP